MNDPIRSPAELASCAARATYVSSSGVNSAASSAPSASSAPTNAPAEVP